MFYEYKVIAPPRRAIRFKDLEKGEHPFHRTIAETLTSMGLEGWSYVGVERLLQVRRSWLFWSREETVEVMVFRREVRAILRGHGDPVAEAPVASARETGAMRPVAMPQPIEAVRARRVTRPETVARVAQGARRILVPRTEIAAE